MEGEDKILVDLGGKPLIAHTVAAFEECEAIGAIVLVVNECNHDAIAQLRGEMGWRKTEPLVLGGLRRQDSVRNGLDALPRKYEWVVVHDGARPFVTPRIIEDGLRAAAATGAAYAVVPAFDAALTPDGYPVAVQQFGESPLAQTPQVFHRGILESPQDAWSIEVAIFDGVRTNIKVRDSADLTLARHLLSENRIRDTFEQIISRDGFLGRHENITQAKIEAYLAGSFRILDIAFEQIASGLQTIGTLNNEEHSELSFAWFKLIGLAWSSLRTSMLVLKHGYYFQSLGLVRTAMEANLVAQDQDFQNHPNPLYVLEEEIGKGDFTINNILQRLPMPNRQVQKNNYGELSESGSHLRRKSLGLIQRGSGMNVAGHYDEDLLLKVLRVILSEMLKLIDVMRNLSELVEFKWAPSAAPVAIDVAALLEDISELLIKEQSESSSDSTPKAK